ncbi:MAG: sensor histidine kinase [Chloroflexota bacterium]|nr:sensor histidine kinase [Chloroflexota bacterium]
MLVTTVAMQPFEHGATVVPAERGQWLIERVAPGGPAWRAGLSAGEAVAWDGRPGESIGRPVELSAEIGAGAVADPQTGAAIPIPGLDPAMRATTLALATAFAAGGAVVALYGRRRVLGAATAAMFGVAIALALGSVAPDAEGVLTLLVFAATGATGVALLWFAAVCPIRGPSFIVPYVPALAVTALAGPVTVLVASYQGRPDLYNAAWVTVAILPTLGLTALLAKCLVTLLDITFPRDRRVARVLLATFLTAALPPTALSLVPAVVSGAEILPYSVSLLAIAATALGVVHVAVPTWRIRFQRVLRTFFLHGAAWIFLFTFYALLVGVIGRYLTDRAGALPVVWTLAAALVGIGVTAPFARWLVLRVLSGWVYQDSYDTQRVMRTASVALASTTSVEQLAESVLAPVRRAIGLDWIAVTRAAPPHDLVAIAFNSLAPTPDDTQVRSAVVAAGGGGRSEIAAVVVPCKIGEPVAAYVVASIREESFGLSQADAELLDALSSQLASFMVRVDLWGQLQDRVRELDETAQRLQDSQQTLRDLYDQVNGMLEAERQRISHDLHDEPLQKLVLLQRALRSAAPGPYRGRDALLRLVDTAAGDLREICERLRPPVLDDLGLEAALRWLVDEASRAAPFQIDLQMDGTPEAERPDVDIETNVFRAAQEALNNALRHAQASSVRIRLTRASDAIRLSVRDDGRGFEASPDFAAYAATGHLGLAGLRERFTRLGGVMQVESQPGGPTVLTVEAPIHAAARAGE